MVQYFLYFDRNIPLLTKKDVNDILYQIISEAKLAKE